ncbi:MAG: hypothetical protein ACLRRH_04015 [Clostridium sp.]
MHKVNEVSIFKFICCILQYFKVTTIIMIFLSIVCLMCDFTKLINIVLEFNALYWGGILLSTFIHEYMHFMFLKRFGVKDVRIKKSFLKFGIVFCEENLKKGKLILVALSGPIICFFIGCILITINMLLCRKIINFISIVYIFHIVNLVPFFGDGKVILKSLVLLMKPFLKRKSNLINKL